MLATWVYSCGGLGIGIDQKLTLLACSEVLSEARSKH